MTTKRERTKAFEAWMEDTGTFLSVGVPRASWHAACRWQAAQAPTAPSDGAIYAAVSRAAHPEEHAEVDAALGRFLDAGVELELISPDIPGAWGHTAVAPDADDRIEVTRGAYTGSTWRVIARFSTARGEERIVMEAEAIPGLLHIFDPVGTKAAPDAGPDWEELYGQLLYAVGNKFPGESRHETALRYIKQAEQPRGFQNSKDSQSKDRE